MNAKGTEWRPGPTVCRCCLTEGCYKDISTEYFWMGKREVYGEMLLDTFNVTIAYSQSGGPNSNSRLICEPCISRLRDANDFRRQVLECEKTFMQHLDPGSSSVADLEAPVETLEDVKLERIKLEKRLSDEDFDERDYDDEDDDDDDMDDEPLTKLASKIPKKETVDLMDLLDNTKAAEKRKSTTKVKAAPSKKPKIVKKEPVKASASKVAPKPEKKKKGENSTSVWQMTASERKNAAMLIQYTTVRPFIFMGHSFKCFFCMDYNYDLASLLEHTLAHTVDSKEIILKKYIPRCKRALQVDISKLKCRLCDKYFENLGTTREHLINRHGKHFYSASNGMTEYKMELVNNMFVCHICGKDFHNFNLLNSHMNSHVGKVVCENCGESFLYQHLLLKHKETHMAKKFNCIYCNKIFSKRGQLKYHTEIVHKGKERVKPKKCPKCSLTFKEHYSKMTHLKEVHGITKSFPCHICNNIFNTRRTLTEHVNKYHTEKYKCEICSKCFAMESKLKQHMPAHTGERNFICPVCKNSYMHKISLKKHMLTHSPMFKFVCTECKASFNSKNQFEKHMKLRHTPYGDVE